VLIADPPGGRYITPELAEHLALALQEAAERGAAQAALRARVSGVRCIPPTANRYAEIIRYAIEKGILE
jgi:hypothetical protein